MTSHAPGSGPCYILRTYSSAWKASLWVPSADTVAAGQADPLLCLELAEVLPTNMAPGTYLLRPRHPGHRLTLPEGRTVQAIPSNKALSVWAGRSGAGSISAAGRALTPGLCCFSATRGSPGIPVASLPGNCLEYPTGHYVPGVLRHSLGEWISFRTRLGRTLSCFFLLQERDVT